MNYSVSVNLALGNRTLWKSLPHMSLPDVLMTFDGPCLVFEKRHLNLNSMLIFLLILETNITEGPI